MFFPPQANLEHTVHICAYLCISVHICAFVNASLLLFVPKLFEAVLTQTADPLQLRCAFSGFALCDPNME